MHWINLACLLALVAVRGPDGKGRGVTRVAGSRFDTIGLFGVSKRAADGSNVQRGFPEWATTPGLRSLALGRRWHFFPAHMIWPVFKPNGSINPQTPEYLGLRLKAQGFASWRLRILGLVERPLELPMQALPVCTQITRHDCVEDWSVIGRWTGVV